jgi:hypothetical protein
LATIFIHSKVVSISSNPNLEDQVSVFMFRNDGVAQLYPQAMSSLSITFYDSQGYGEGIPTCLHIGSKY